MAIPVRDAGNYKTPFYCALCGCPFAQVYRSCEDCDESRQQASCQQHERYSRYTICRRRNNCLSADEVRQAAGADQCLDLKLREGQYTQGRLRDHRVRRAYEGRKVSEEQVQWISSVRALVHRSAEVQPEGGLDQLEDGTDVYLTGRGRVAQDASWAYAPPSIETEMEDEDEEGFLGNFNELYGFHLYQEPERNDRRFCYSSIPFHDQCWDILDVAVHTIQESRGLPDSALGEGISLDDLWRLLTSSLPTALPGKLSDLTIDACRRGTASEASTGIQSGAFARPEIKLSAGRNCWLHIEGFHWLVVDPSTSPLLNQPFALPEECGTAREVQPYQAPLPRNNGQVEDSFFKIPPELILEVMSFLSCREVFQWRKASVAIGQYTIPAREYRRFVREEYAFLPQLRRKAADDIPEHQLECLDWKHVFENISKKCRQDDSLRNRRRIWNAVWPVAEELVETSTASLELMDHSHNDNGFKTGVKRGYVGVLSGAEGYRHTVTLTITSADLGSTQSGDIASNRNVSVSSEASVTEHKKEPQNALRPAESLRGIREVWVWLDPVSRNVCGVEFFFDSNEQSPWPSQVYSKRFGTTTSLRRCHENALPGVVFLGFNLCWYDSCIQGLQLVFECEEGKLPSCNSREYLSEKFGNWRGPVRRLQATPGVSSFAGITGFISNAKKIETLAILEEASSEADSQILTLGAWPRRPPLSHHEASMWMTLPPGDVEILERSGPYFSGWSTCAADWHVLGFSQQNKCTGTLERSRSKLTHIEGFSFGEYLSGLTFTDLGSEDESRTKIGACEGHATNMLTLSGEDRILAVVISHGSLGIHSVQIVTASACATFGSRYFGNHTVYILEDSLLHDRERIGHLIYLKSRIIGFHGVYHSQLGRLLQLGVITEQKSPLNANTMVNDRINVISKSKSDKSLIIPASEKIPLPFVSADEHKNPWVDGPRPSNYFLGYKKSDSLNQLATPPQGMFAGWVSFDEPISAITTYGNLNGIRFSFQNRRLPDRYFGATDTGLEKHTQKLARNDRVAAIAVQRESQGAGHAYPSPSSRHLKFLSRSSPRDKSLDIEADSANLAGVQFFFTATSIIAWDPLLNSDSPTNLGEGVWESPCNVCKKSDSAYQPAFLPQIYGPSFLRKYRHLIETFSHRQRIDGLQAFTSNRGRFCGLRFRRNGAWDKNTLGRRSQVKTKFLLQPNEELVSIKVSRVRNAGVVGAVAFHTSHDRTSSWMGNPAGLLNHQIRPEGYRISIVCLEFSDIQTCSDVGFIYERDEGVV